MIFKDIAEWEVGDSELAQHTITNLHFEIDRLNKIINELENIIDIEMNEMGYAKYDSCLMLMKRKIKELKGSNKD